MSLNEYCVYTPDQPETAKNLIPHFYRMRKVRNINDKYFACSCGLPSRMKIPCRHILSVVGDYTIEMFALRWLIIYQHAFLTEGFEDVTKVLQRLEEYEFSRQNSIGEIILVNNFSSISATSNYPQKIGNSTDADINNIRAASASAQQ